MRILAIQGSPRRDGNTQALLDVVLDAARRTGAEFETVRLADLKNLTGCKECYACQRVKGEPACAVADDMQPIFEKVLRTEMTVWATPVFCWSPAWPIKMAMDRFFCMFKLGDGEDIDCLLRGRKMAAVITAGGPESDGADLVTETFRRMAEFGKTDWRGAFVAANVKDAAGIRADADLVARAQAFGHALAS